MQKIKMKCYTPQSKRKYITKKQKELMELEQHRQEIRLSLYKKEVENNLQYRKDIYFQLYFPKLKYKQSKQFLLSNLRW